MPGARLIVAGLVLAAAPAAAQERSVTLGDAIRRAAVAQPRMVQAGGQVRSADARVKTAKGSFLPNLSLNGNGQSFYSENSRIDPATGLPVQSGTTSTSVSGTLSSSLELFGGFRRSNELKAANANADAAEAGFRDATFQQSLETTNQFFDALAAQKLVGVRESGVRRAEEQLKVSVARVQAGAGTRSDSLRSLVGLGNAQLELVTVQSQLATAEANLGRLIGETDRVAAADDSAFYQMVAAIEASALRDEALSRSPSVLASESSVRAAEASLRSSRSPYWPTVNLSASTSLNGSGSNDYQMLSQRQLSLGFNWPIFSRFTREQNIAAQAVGADNARATYQEARRTVVANMTQRLAELEAARLRIEITQRSVEAAREDLRVQQERYRLGASTIVDVLLTTEQLNQAEVDAVSARFDYLRAKAAIETLIGRGL
jgi:outer membrane protein